jgi:hypothetical protein
VTRSARALVHNCVAHPLWWLGETLVDVAELGLEVAKTVRDLAVDLHDDTAPEADR